MYTIQIPLTEEKEEPNRWRLGCWWNNRKQTCIASKPINSSAWPVVNVIGAILADAITLVSCMNWLLLINE
jgi:hypothetical protein